MVNKIHFEWQVPPEYITHFKNSLKEQGVSFFHRTICQLLSCIFYRQWIPRNKTAIQISDTGIHSSNLIKFEEITNIVFEWSDFIPDKKIKMMTVYHYEDLIMKINDVSTVAIPDEYDILPLQKYLRSKNIKVENEL
jgi:hypothetical protein